MASNPLYNTNDGPNNATQPAKAVNDSQTFVNRKRNTFDLSYFNYKTQRFGQYEPFFVMEGVTGDTIPLSSSHSVRSLPMASPFLSSLTLSKDYFMVPMQAVLPNTWELIFRNPASGDDVPEDANCIWDIFSFSRLAELGAAGNLSNAQLLKVAFALESIFSCGSLISQLGFNFQDTSFKKDSSFDYIFNTALQDFISKDPSITVTFPDGIEKELSLTLVSPSSLIDFARQNYIYITNCNVAFNYASLSQWAQLLSTMFSDFTDFYLNVSRILAYQLTFKQFYVNSKIDAIYNSQLYRDNYFYLLKQLSTSISQSLSYESFSYNGINVPYDFFSKHYWDKVVKAALTSTTLSTNPENVIDPLCDVIYYVFSFNRVLKFGDYFTSSRTQPLGSDVNGEMNAPVVGEKVAAIDMSKSIVMQRFLNNVVKLGNDFGEYLARVFRLTHAKRCYRIDGFTAIGLLAITLLL